MSYTLLPQKKNYRKEWKKTINDKEEIEFTSSKGSTIYIGTQDGIWIADYHLYGSGRFSKFHKSKELALKYANRVMEEDL